MFAKHHQVWFNSGIEDGTNGLIDTENDVAAESVVPPQPTPLPEIASNGPYSGYECLSGQARRASANLGGTASHRP